MHPLDSKKSALLAFALAAAVAAPAYAAGSGAAATCDTAKVAAAVDAAAGAWKAQDWKSMYEMLSSADRSRVNFLEFAKDQQQLATTEKLSAYRVLAVSCVTADRAQALLELFLMKSPGTRPAQTGSGWYEQAERDTWDLVQQHHRWRFRLRPRTAPE